MTYNPLFPNLEGVRYKYYHRKREGLIKNPGIVTAVVHDYFEPIENIIQTISAIAQSNHLAKEYGIPRVVDRVILSSQSADENVKSIFSELTKEKQRLSSELDDSEILLPEIGLFHIGEKMAETISSRWDDVNGLEYFVRSVRETGTIPGKGNNMEKSGMMADSNVVFFDCDYAERSSRQALGQFLGMQMGYEAVIGTFTRYHKNNKGEIERGGRVNAAMGGLFDMLLNKRRLMCLLGYPLSGDQGFSKEKFQRFKHHKRYGQETTLRLQAHSELNGFINYPEPWIADELLLQVEIGKNDDRPIGKGKSKEETLKGIENMQREIIEAFLTTTGINNLTRHWKSPNEFLVDFKERQINRMHKWAHASLDDYGEILPISGGFSDVELEKLSYGITSNVVHKFFDDPMIQTKNGKIPYRRSLMGDFLPSISNLIENNGEERFNDMVKDLREHYVMIV